jgi:hypothetical protein
MTVGTDEFNITIEAANEKEVFEKLSFFANMPKTGPNGETDLKLRFKQVDDYTYYSLVSEQAGQEFRFGISKKDKSLFPKGWEPLYGATTSSNDKVNATPSTFKRPAPAKVEQVETEEQMDFPEESPVQTKSQLQKTTAATPVNTPALNALKNRFGSATKTNTPDLSKNRR